MSLTEMETNKNGSSQYIAENAQASEKQTVGISQIDTGINQAAHVVAQGSAIVEKTAVASEDMNNQAAALEDLLGLFSVKSGKQTKNLRSMISPITKRSIK